MATLDFGNFPVNMQNPAALGATVFNSFPQFNFLTGAFIPDSPGASTGVLEVLNHPEVEEATAVVSARGQWAFQPNGEPTAASRIFSLVVQNPNDIAAVTYRVNIFGLNISYATFKAALLAKDLSSLYAGQPLQILGNTFADTLVGGALNDELFGFGGSDSLVGGAGNDYLDGMAGADVMAGGAGNDEYVVNHAGDSVIENGGEGIDKVFSSVRHTLGDNVENLTLLGAVAIDGTGNTVANRIEGNAAANVLRGLGGNDRLFGMGGNDRLDGGAGIDTMTGGAGNDVYIQNATGDSIVELPGGGTDTVQSSVTTTLSANVERLVLTGSGDLDGTGNSGNNVLTGNSGRNVLAGSGGNDTLNGGVGQDTLNGGNGDDVLAGEGGADSLNGGSGADSMSGGTGSDLYVVDAAGDRVTELADEGVDTVRSSVTRKLEANVENLVLTGSALNGTGNGLDNEITGNSGHNRLSGSGGNDTLAGGTGRDTLIGGAGDDSLLGGGGDDSLNGGTGNDFLDGESGSDSMRGGDGDDTYVSDSAADVIGELADQGVDTVLSSATRTLGDHLEHLTLTGDGNIDGTGNELVNAITGNDGANVLDGAGGADSLAGGGGDDTLVWDATDVLVDGGAGEADVLRVTGTTALDLTAVADTTIVNVEVIELAGTNTLTLAASDVLALSTTSDTLRVDGGVGDAVNAGNGWTQIGNINISGQDYAQFTKDGATLQVDLDVNQGGIGVLQPVIEQSALNGKNGFRLDGIDGGDQSGHSVASAGDVNGDGYDDLIVGARLANGSAGESYVVFGSGSSFASSMAFSALNGTNGFRFDGIDGDDQSGHSVASAGDVNGDGFDDLIVGAWSANGAAGTSYVVFGKASGFGSVLALSALDGANGFHLDGIDVPHRSGYSVASAGDVNGDGYDDLIVGAPGTYGLAGASYVVFGGSGGGSELDLSALDGANGFRMDGVNVFDRSGSSVASAGDVNRDGYDDLIVGAWGANGYAGASYVVFGKASGFGSELDLSALDGANGFRLDGIYGDDRSGWSVASAGDVNGDGYGDLIIGAYAADNAAGASYVVFGWIGGSSLALSELDGTIGFRLDGDTFDWSGVSVASAGDVNGDGYDDLIVGAPAANGFSGASYVVFGKASGFGSELDLSALDGANGFRLDGVGGDDRSGSSVTSAGDVNGDGYDDLIVGAPRANDSAGESYVVYGRDFTGVVDFAGTANADSLTGTAAAEVFVAGRGNDTLAGGGGADVFRGGQGNDRIEIADAAFFHVDGGTGIDTLALTGGGITLDLTAIANGKVTGIEIIDLTGSGNNTLILDNLEVLNLSDSSNTLRVDGGAGDVVSSSDFWTFEEVVDIGFQTYAQYRIGEAVLQVDLDIDRSGLAFLSTSAIEGINGFHIVGGAATGGSFVSVASAGDLDADGLDDLIIGKWLSNVDGRLQAGASYVILGAGIGEGEEFDLATLDGQNGFRMDGIDAFDHLGAAVASAGDVNGDGFQDLLVAAPGAEPEGAYAYSDSGETYVVFGTDGGFDAVLNLELLDGTNGFRLDGADGLDQSGFSVASAGDINGDGFADLLIGAPSATIGGLVSAGQTFVVFGKASGFSSSLGLGSLGEEEGFRLDGHAVQDHSGISVASAGDVNGDGYSDFLVGGSGVDVGGENSAGATYVVFGKVSGFGTAMDLDALDGTNGFRLEGVDQYDWSGASVSSAGDFNGDGLSDLLIGAPRVNPGNAHQAGASYIVFGATGGFGASINLSNLDGTNGFRMHGAALGQSGYSVRSAGDVNGDGFDDVIIGTWRQGKSFLVFGAESGFDASLDLMALDGSNGFRIVGQEGVAVAGAGDVNGDGFDDVIVGLDPAGAPFDSGEVYVIYGGNFNSVIDFLGGVGDDVLTGTDAAEVLVAGRGNDTMTGGGGADVFRGGQGNDRIEIADVTFFDVDGGGGTDTLAISGGGLTLDLTATADSKLTGIEVVDLTGSGSNTLVLDALEVLNLSDITNTLRVDGNAGDVVVVRDLDWEFASTEMVDGNSYNVFLHDAAILYVDADVQLQAGISLDELDGSNGFRLEGAVASGNFGRSLDGLGDFNGDGFGDVIVGAEMASQNGTSYVLFGAASGFAPSLNVSMLDGASGFRVEGETAIGGTVFDQSGYSVSAAGDMNGDGFADLIVGAQFADPSFQGASYVIFGKEGVLPASIGVSDLDGINGFKLTGASTHDLFGRPVAAAGDVNGDGFDDVVIGAGAANGYGAHSGSGYVVFGKADGFAASMSVSTLDSTSGFQIDFGLSVNGAGDINGDGLDDIVIGAFHSNENGAHSGAAYVLFGQASGAATEGFTILGDSANDELGLEVNSAGDVNGDGFGDLIVGATGDGSFDNPASGGSYVVFGGDSGFLSEIVVSDLDGMNGFSLVGASAGDRSGRAVDSAGDVNGDGFDDLIVGAAQAGSGNTGAAYVIFGKASGFSSSFELSTLDGTSGFRLEGGSGGDYAGRAVRGAGDVNGDGFDDIVVGAFGADPNGSFSGAGYVVFGGDFSGAVGFQGGAGDDALMGSAAAESFVAGLGNDTLAGGGGADVFRGGQGDDRIEIADATFFDIDGGTGSDTLALVGPDLALDLTAIANSKVTGIEKIDLVAGSGTNGLTLALGDVLNLSDASNTLTIDGDSDDAVTVADGTWTAAAPEDGYNVYTLGAATLRIAVDITVDITV